MIETHRVVYSRKSDGGVSFYHPDRRIERRMTGGGGYWTNPPRGFFERQIASKAKQGVSEDAARAWINALQFGGCTTREAWAVCAQHCCARFGHSLELFAIADLPDYWFRDAWRRGGNSGAVVIDFATAQLIQYERIVDAVNEENKRRERMLFGPDPLRLDKGRFSKAIMQANGPDELKRVWPEELERKAA